MFITYDFHIYAVGTNHIGSRMGYAVNTPNSQIIDCMPLLPEDAVQLAKMLCLMKETGVKNVYLLDAAPALFSSLYAMIYQKVDVDDSLLLTYSKDEFSRLACSKFHVIIDDRMSPDEWSIHEDVPVNQYREDIIFRTNEFGRVDVNTAALNAFCISDCRAHDYKTSLDVGCRPRFAQMCTISILHLKEDTKELLKNGETWLDVLENKRGFIVEMYNVHQFFDAEKDLPEDLTACIRYAYDSGSDILCFDEKGVLVPELPVYG